MLCSVALSLGQSLLVLLDNLARVEVLQLIVGREEVGAVFREGNHCGCVMKLDYEFIRVELQTFRFKLLVLVMVVDTCRKLFYAACTFVLFGLLIVSQIGKQAVC